MSNETSGLPANKNEKAGQNKGTAEWERPLLRRLMTKEAQMPNIGKFNENNTGS
jgi:hypothetical protein